MPRPLSRLARSLGLAALLALAAALPSPGHADGYLDEWHPYQTFWSVGWEAGFPVGSLNKNWVASPGWLGGGFDVRVGVWGRLSVGLAGTWNWFDHTYSNLTIQNPGSTYTGTIYRRLSAFTF